MADFAGWVKERRKGLDLTQAELAERVGCSLIMVAKVESGERRPSKQIAELLARHLGIPEDQHAAFVRFARGQTDSPPLLPAAQAGPAFADIPASALAGRLIGRDGEMADLVGRLTAADEARLVTLVGPGGVGKTQLALRAAHAARGEFEHGVCFVDASTSRDAADLAQAMARAMHAGDAPGDGLLAAIVRHIAPLELLLILDNLEQVQDGGDAVAELLAGCPRARLIATSREPLRLRGEALVQVQPLPIPITVRGEGASSAELAAIPAVALFVERAQEADPGFRLTAANARAVAELCRRLDGLPLALELAAARVGLMTPQALLNKLVPAQRVNLRLIAGGAAASPERQRTLQGAIQWSYDLLDPLEQTVFRSLGAFSGGFSLEAAEAVLCAGAADEGGAVAWDAIAAQLHHSLLQRRDNAAGEPRFAQLETIHEFAVQQLDASPEAADVRRRHAKYYARFAWSAAAKLLGDAQRDGLVALDEEYPNIRAALDWLLEHDPDRGQALANALVRYWDLRGLFDEGRRHLERALAHTPETSPGRAWVLIGLATFDYSHSAFDQAIQRCEEAIAICHHFHDRHALAQATLVLAQSAEAKRDVERAKVSFEAALTAARAIGDEHLVARTRASYAKALREHESDLGAADASLDEALTISRRIGDRRGEAHALMQRSEVAAARGDYGEAVRLAATSAEVFRELGAANELGWAVLSLGESMINAGRSAEAGTHLEQSLAIFERIGLRWGIAIDLHHLGRAALATGDLDRARGLFARSLALCRDLKRPLMAARCVAGFAGIAAAEGRFELAAALIGAARPSLPPDLTPADWAEVRAIEEAARAALGDADYAAAVAAIDLERAILLIG